MWGSTNKITVTWSNIKGNSTYTFEPTEDYTYDFQTISKAANSLTPNKFTIGNAIRERSQPVYKYQFKLVVEGVTYLSPILEVDAGLVNYLYLDKVKDTDGQNVYDTDINLIWTSARVPDFTVKYYKFIEANSNLQVSSLISASSSDYYIHLNSFLEWGSTYRFVEQVCDDSNTCINWKTSLSFTYSLPPPEINKNDTFAEMCNAPASSDINPLIQWNSIKLATSYNIRNPNFTNRVSSITGITRYYYFSSIDNMGNETKLFNSNIDKFQIQSCNDLGCGSWSKPMSFNIKASVRAANTRPSNSVNITTSGPKTLDVPPCTNVTFTIASGGGGGGASGAACSNTWRGTRSSLIGNSGNRGELMYFNLFTPPRVTQSSATNGDKSLRITGFVGGGGGGGYGDAEIPDPGLSPWITYGSTGYGGAGGTGDPDGGNGATIEGGGGGGAGGGATTVTFLGFTFRISGGSGGTGSPDLFGADGNCPDVYNTDWSAGGAGGGPNKCPLRSFCNSLTQNSTFSTRVKYSISDLPIGGTGADASFCKEDNIFNLRGYCTVAGKNGGKAGTGYIKATW